MTGDQVLDTQGGILVEVDLAKTFRAGEDGLLHFRIRNLTEEAGRLRMRLRIPRVELHRVEARIPLRPEAVHHVRFPLSAERPGEKFVEALEVRFELGGVHRRLVLPDDGLTFYVAPGKGAEGGSISLHNVNFDFRDHVGDVALQDLIRRQDAEEKRRSGERWTALALMSRPVDGHVVVQAPRQRGVRDLVLLGPRSMDGHELRVFLFARKMLALGSRSASRQKEKVPLILRRLPCRSPSDDPENHFLSSAISALHARVALHDERLCVRDESMNGTLLDREPLPAARWEPLPRRFELGITARETVIALEGRVLYPAHPGRGLSLGWAPQGEMGNSVEVGAEHPLAVDALRLGRADNIPEHLYVQVFRGATVGASAECAVRPAGEGIAAHHAEIVFYQGEWFVRTLDADAVTEVNGYPVRPEEYVSLAPGKTLTLGQMNFRLKATTREEMTSL